MTMGEIVLFCRAEVFLYNIPANIQRKTSYIHRASDWDISDPTWHGKVLLIGGGSSCTIQLEDKRGGLFGKGNVESFPCLGLQPVVDSSRYFTVRIQTISGGNGLFGMGFTNRKDSGDFRQTLKEYFSPAASKKRAAQDNAEAKSSPTPSKKTKTEEESKSDKNSIKGASIISVNQTNGKSILKKTTAPSKVVVSSTPQQQQNKPVTAAVPQAKKVVTTTPPKQQQKVIVPVQPKKTVTTTTAVKQPASKASPAKSQTVTVKATTSPTKKVAAAPKEVEKKSSPVTTTSDSETGTLPAIITTPQPQRVKPPLRSILTQSQKSQKQQVSTPPAAKPASSPVKAQGKVATPTKAGQAVTVGTKKVLSPAAGAGKTIFVVKTAESSLNNSAVLKNPLFKSQVPASLPEKTAVVKLNKAPIANLSRVGATKINLQPTPVSVELAAPTIQTHQVTKQDESIELIDLDCDDNKVDESSSIKTLNEDIKQTEQVIESDSTMEEYENDQINTVETITGDDEETVKSVDTEELISSDKKSENESEIVNETVCEVALGVVDNEEEEAEQIISDIQSKDEDDNVDTIVPDDNEEEDEDPGEMIESKQIIDDEGNYNENVEGGHVGEYIEDQEMIEQTGFEQETLEVGENFDGAITEEQIVEEFYEDEGDGQINMVQGGEDGGEEELGAGNPDGQDEVVVEDNQVEFIGGDTVDDDCFGDQVQGLDEEPTNLDDIDLIEPEVFQN